MPKSKLVYVETLFHPDQELDWLSDCDSATEHAQADLWMVVVI